MKKVMITLMALCLLVGTPLWAVDFGESDYKVVFEKDVLKIIGNKINLNVDAKTGEVTKLIPATWKTLSPAEETRFLFLSSSATSTLIWSGVNPPEKKYKETTKVIGPFTVTYEYPKKVLIVKGDILKYFVLRIQDCGQVEKLVWKKINENEE